MLNWYTLEKSKCGTDYHKNESLFFNQAKMLSSWYVYFLNVEDGQKNIHCMFLSVKNKITIAELHKTKF